MSEWEKEQPEIWKPVIGYEGAYSVSSLGNIRNDRRKKGKFLAQCGDLDGYGKVKLCLNGIDKCISAHIVVATAFCDRSRGNEVNHINGIKYDNRASNLEWALRHQNLYHAAHEINAFKGRRSLTTDEVIDIRVLYLFGAKIKDLALCFNTSRQHVGRLVNMKSWKHLNNA